eukprot:CAMPEP_0198258190 /NCGR_PEP_ID=MMETSP1447-20131203/7686_1 /TAXON_ID=420782 /ORGANISM="Chaetoceros dichaeta, Strain CCMP1751" /LENGTH=650 /DNA_ID=CAMNT_0043945261 /DNA_START=62 /DNA_END=2014 /DNA_ORIENTATION=+
MIDCCVHDGTDKLISRRNRINPRNNNLVLNAIYLLTVTQFLGVTTADWIDPDTPSSAYKTRACRVPEQKKRGDTTPHQKRSATPSHAPSNYPTEFPTLNPTVNPTVTGQKQSPLAYNLVMSDEFNVAGRTFEDGSDPKWTALEKNDYTNNALHYYSASNAYTNDDGDLIIKSEAKESDFIGFDDEAKIKTIQKKNFKSAMLQSWNKFCFTGGIIETEVELPGKHDISGLWPAFWLLGNMARHTYLGSTNHVWPWSSVVCTEKANDAQLINGCLNTIHYGLHPKAGRGAPEIDIFEVQPGSEKGSTGAFKMSPVGQPFMSSSYQVAPGKPQRPWAGHWPGPGQWYDGLYGGHNTSLNIYFYGSYNHVREDTGEKDYWSDAVSFNHQLEEKHFTTKHKYRLEWDVPDKDEGTDGYIRWFIDDKFVLEINGTGIVDAGLGSEVSSEPMSIIMNTAISKEWGFPKPCPANCGCEKYDCNSTKFQEICGFPHGFCEMMKNETGPEYKVNYVRVYQNPNNPKQKVGCSTPERPTKRYIKGHEEFYKTENDQKPLKGIVAGGGTCRKVTNILSKSCGGPTRGTCSSRHVCECKAGWVGPQCLAHDGFDPVQYDKPDDFQDLEFTGPYMFVQAIALLLITLCAAIIIGVGLLCPPSKT